MVHSRPTLCPEKRVVSSLCEHRGARYTNLLHTQSGCVVCLWPGRPFMVHDGTYILGMEGNGLDRHTGEGGNIRVKG